MTFTPKIALVEDDEDLRLSTQEYLIASGYSTWGVDSVEAFCKKYVSNPVDVAIVDLGLPGECGLTLTQLLNDNANITVIILSARDTVEDRLKGLAAGADRFLVKPVDFKELIANIDAASKRLTAKPVAPSIAAQIQSDHLPPSQTTPGRWSLDEKSWCLISPDGQQVDLTPKEYGFLTILMQRSRSVVQKREISSIVFGSRILNGSERLNVLVARLRKKAKSRLAVELPVKTVHYTGYTFNEECSICKQ